MSSPSSNPGGRSPSATKVSSRASAPPVSRTGSIMQVKVGSGDLDDFGYDSLDSLGESNESFLVNSDGLMALDDDDSESETEDDIGNRLHGNSVYNVNRERNEAIVSILPSDTLRWIKKRRRKDCKLKVAMSHFRERQLREIFNGLDYKTEGEINLDDLKNACAYVEESLEGKRGDQLHNLQEMFTLMDEDKSGSVDFQEFCAGMSGSSKSTIDSASEHAIDKLHWKFVEYSRIYKRQKAIDEIYSHDENRKPDSERYNSFRTLFNVGWGLKSHTIKNFDKDQEAEKELKLKQQGGSSTANTRTGTANTNTSTHTDDDGSATNTTNTSAEHDVSHGKHNKHHGPPPGADAETLHKHNRKHLSHSASVSQILFMTEGRKLYMPSKADTLANSVAMAAHGEEMPLADMSVKDKNAAYEELQARLRCHRIIAQENMLRDPDARQVQRRIEQEAKFIRDRMSYHPGVQKKPPKAKNMSKTFEPLIASRNVKLEVRAKTEQQMKLTALKQAQLLGVTSNYNSLTAKPGRPVSPAARLLKPLSATDKKEERQKLRALEKIYSESDYFRRHGHYDEDEEDTYYCEILNGGSNSTLPRGSAKGRRHTQGVGDGDNDSLCSEGSLQQRREHRANERLKHHESAFRLANITKRSLSADELPHNMNTYVCTLTGPDKPKSRPSSPYVPVPALSNSTNPVVRNTNPIPDNGPVQRKRATSPQIGVRPKQVEMYQFHSESEEKTTKTVIGTAFMKTVVPNTQHLKTLTNQRKHKLNSIASRSAKQLGYHPFSPNRLGTS